MPQKTWWDYAKQFPAEVGKDVSGIYGGLAHAATHPVETASDALAAIGSLVPDTSTMYLPPKVQDERQRMAQRTALGIGNQIRQDLTPSHWYHHPVSTGLDALAVLDPAIGGLDAAGATRAASALRQAKRVPAAAALPVTYPLGKAGKLAGKAVGAGLRLRAKTPAAVEAAIQQSGLHPAVSAHPKVQSTLSDIVGQKGASPAAVREAVIRAAMPEGTEVPVTRGVTTGKKPARPTISDNSAGAAKADAVEAVRSRTQAIAPPPETDLLGNDFISQRLEAERLRSEAYHRAGQHNVVIAPHAIGSLADMMEDAFRAERKKGTSIPKSVSDFKLSSSFPESEKLLLGGGSKSSIFDRLKAFSGGSGLDLQDANIVRRDINNAWRGASAADRSVLKPMLDTFDDWLEKTLGDENLHIGDDGPKALQDYKDARQTHKDIINTFDNSPNPNIKSASTKVGQHIDENGALAGAPAGLASDVTDTLTNGVFDPKANGPRPGRSGKPSGKVTYDSLSAGPSATSVAPLSPEGIDALQSHVKASALSNPIGGKDVDALLGGEYGDLFAPHEGELRLQGTANDILREPQVGRSDLDKGSNWVHRAGSYLLGDAAGDTVGHFVSQYPVLGPVAARVLGPAFGVGAASLESALEKRSATKAAQKEMSGAPVAMEDIDFSGLGKIANVARAVNEGEKDVEQSAGIPTPRPVSLEDLAKMSQDNGRGEQPAFAPPAGQGPSLEDLAKMSQGADRAPHAAGGATGARAHVNPHTVDRLLNRLIKATKAARNDTKKSTEHLLAQDDATVAKALAIAKAAI